VYQWQLFAGLSFGRHHHLGQGARQNGPAIYSECTTAPGAPTESVTRGKTVYALRPRLPRAAKNLATPSGYSQDTGLFYVPSTKGECDIWETKAPLTS